MERGPGKLKTHECITCRKELEVEDDYKEISCCSGLDCGCRGMPVNPVFCSECEDKIFGRGNVQIGK